MPVRIVRLKKEPFLSYMIKLKKKQKKTTH